MKRFWEKVDMRDADDCWRWKASRWWNGYGVFYLSRGRRVKAHRFSWELANGAIPHGLNVLHHCDNPSCVNPHHLWLGTQRENVKDRDSKGHQTPLRGADNGNAKLAEGDVVAIRELGKIMQQRDIAKQFNVGQSTVGRILRGETWWCLK